MIGLANSLRFTNNLLNLFRFPWFPKVKSLGSCDE